MWALSVDCVIFHTRVSPAWCRPQWQRLCRSQGLVKLAAVNAAQTVLLFTDLHEPSGVAVDAAGSVYVAVATARSPRLIADTARSSKSSIDTAVPAPASPPPPGGNRGEVPMGSIVVVGGGRGIGAFPRIFQ